MTDYYLVNHCSSERATVGIKSYLSSRLKLHFKTKIQNPKQFQFNFKKNISISFQYQYPKFYLKILFKSFQKSNKMSENIDIKYKISVQKSVQPHIKSEIQVKMPSIIHLSTLYGNIPLLKSYIMTIKLKWALS